MQCHIVLDSGHTHTERERERERERGGINIGPETVKY